MGNINELTVQEKRGLEPLVRSRYNNVISQLRDTEKHDIADLVGKIAKKFKVDTALTKIRQHEEAIAQTKNAIAALGFEMGTYDSGILTLKKDYNSKDGNYQVDYKRPAGKMYYSLTKARPDIASVEKQRDKAVTDLWLSTQKEEARVLVEAKIDVLQIEMK